MRYDPGAAAGQQPSLANAPAVSSKRMTYGSISSQGRETREREELFSGAAARGEQQTPWGQEQQQFGGREELTNAQLMQQGLEQHRSTTMTTRRALQIVEQTKEIQGTTQAALADQREQMHRIEDDMDRIGQDLSYSERILRFMKLCCCVGFFCSCCTEPGRATKDERWRGAGSASQRDRDFGPPGSQSMQPQRGMSKKHAAAQQAAAGRSGAAAYPGVSTRGLDEVGLGEQAAAIDAETQQQNQYLDEISKGLDQLKVGAQRMNEELRYQESHADRIRHDADTLEGKLHNVNREGFRRI